jgi:lipoprotein NlpI
MKPMTVAAALISALGAQPTLAASFDDLNAGIQAHNLDQWRISIAALDKALGAGDLLPSQQFTAHLDRGVAYQAMGDSDLALDDYSASLVLQPNNAEALSARAHIYLAAGKFEETASDLDALIALRPMLLEAYTLRVPVDAKLNKFSQSVADAKKVLALQPPGSSRGITTGIMAWQAGEIGVAEDNFAYAASQGTEGIYGWLWLALTDFRTGKPVPKDKLPDFDRNSWPAPLVNFFNGDAPQDTVFAAAGEGEDFLTRGRICEANFYVGEWLLLHQNKGAAQSIIQKAAGICPMDFVEWSPAQTELAGLTGVAP